MNSSFAASLRRLGRGLTALDPLRLVVLGYASYIITGWALLCLPWSQHRPGTADWLDHLFIATSAVSTTGLSPVSTADTYTWFGEAVVLALIQFGGLGYMTVSSCLLMAFSGGRIAPWRERVGAVSLMLPPGFDFRRFLLLTMSYTLVIEAAGAVLLYPIFRDGGAVNPVWQATFHSVSSFCTAGFGLFNDSFESYRGHHGLNLVIIVLSYLGAIGFLVVNDAWLSLVRRKAAVTFTTKIILTCTAAISVVGTGLLVAGEPSLATLPLGERWMAAWFQVASASTTVGFNTIPIGAISGASLFLLTVVMIIGASPAGTGGGLKTTTFTALWGVMLAVMRRRERPSLLGREIPVVRIRSAVASLLLYSLTLAAGIFALALVQPESALADQVFECISALGTVGLSRGLTGNLNSAGLGIVTLLMFIGRVGPLGLGMIFFRPGPEPVEPEEDVIV
ncbi:MAG TPA: potassium transporter TrkG [Opitutaceae bacterium]